MTKCLDATMDTTIDDFAFRVVISIQMQKFKCFFMIFSVTKIA